MVLSERVDRNSDFQQIALPLDLAIGEHVLQHSRLEADSQPSAWYELYLVVTPQGFLIEKHSGSLMQPDRLKETWFRRSLREAKRKYSQIFSFKLNQTRKKHGKYKVMNDENAVQQQLFC
jgi:hypothetical protein